MVSDDASIIMDLIINKDVSEAAHPTPYYNFEWAYLQNLIGITILKLLLVDWMRAWLSTILKSWKICSVISIAVKRERERVVGGWESARLYNGF